MNDSAMFAAMQASLGMEVESGNWAALGAALHGVGAAEAALLAFEKATKQSPREIGLWHALAAVRLELKLPQAAWQACDEALRLNADDVQTLFNSGVVREALNDDVGACELYEKVLTQEHGHYGALCNLPRLHWRLGHEREAVSAAETAVLLYPDDAWLHINLGDLLLGNTEAERAITSFMQALELQPDLHYARYALSIALALEGCIEDAYAARNAALAAEPALATTYASPLANDHLQGGNRPTPERVAVQMMFLSMYNCDWHNYAGMVGLFGELAQGHRGNPPLSDYEMPYLSHGLPVSEEIRQQVARQTAAAALAKARDLRIFLPERLARKKLRIGYLSANFSPHPNAWLMGELYSRHDRERFVVYAYSLGPPSESTERASVIRGADEFHDIHALPAQAAAQLIANHCIDILIDLSGFTRNTKPEILALHPAALQASYVGFMGTQGAPYIEYALLDRIALTREVRPFWDESIAYLPYCSHHCELPRPSAATPARIDVGLPKDAFVMCVLHSPRKIDPQCFAVWVSLLREIPHAVLWFYRESQAQVDNLCREAAAMGVQRSQLVFSPLVGHDEHLARYPLADVCLDTFVYNGHTTTVDALGMGVPVVTLSGTSVCGRLATSMLLAHGLPELVGTSEDEFKAIVRRLANDAEWRQQMRERTKNHATSKLFRPEQRARELEAAYEIMWARHQSGLPPEDFDVPAQ